MVSFSESIYCNVLSIKHNWSIWKKIQFTKLIIGINIQVYGICILDIQIRQRNTHMH